MTLLSYKPGDIVRWKHRRRLLGKNPLYSYGMMVKDPETINGGKYFYDNAPLPEEPNLDCIKTTVAITVFSFKEQKIIVLYQSPEEPPITIERVCFSVAS
tara:strand:+ start:274 stop:573 length:300 start_codon:yes stop_codon:yes gene_type:complete